MEIRLYRDNLDIHNEIACNCSEEDFLLALEKIQESFLETSNWIKSNLEKNQENLIFYNFISSSVTYIDILIKAKLYPVQLLAFCTRSLYELHLQVLDIILDDSNLQRWANQAQAESKEFKQTLLSTDFQNYCSQKEILAKSIKEQENMLKQNNIKLGGRADIADIAKRLGKQQEHYTLYQIFNIFVHPSSFVVNSGNEIQTSQYKNMFLEHAQLYAHDIMRNIRQRINFIPNDDQLIIK